MKNKIVALTLALAAVLSTATFSRANVAPEVQSKMDRMIDLEWEAIPVLDLNSMTNETEPAIEDSAGPIRRIHDAKIRLLKRIFGRRRGCRC